MNKKEYSYVDYYLGILSIIVLIIYISLVSTERYINKNSPEWASASLDDKKFVGYTNMVGNFFMILLCGFDSVLFMNTTKVYASRYVGKLIILILFIGLAYDVVPDNSSYGKFNAALQPLVGYLQVLSIGTIVQIMTRLDLKLHTYRSRKNSDTSDDIDDSKPRSRSRSNSLESFLGEDDE